jgi:hypothetical protein
MAKERFRDTKVGKFLKVKAPKILEVVGDALPDKGLLGIVKNLIDGSEELTPEEKTMLHQHIKDIYGMEIQDKASARDREVEILKAGGSDWLFNLTGIVGLIVFCFIVYAIVYLQVPNENKEIWIHLIGISEGVVLSIFGY